MTMPFGKHKGEDLADIPVDYLVWIEENCDWIRDDLREAINDEIKFRSSDPERSSRGRDTGRRF